jgi:hypothetical protein
MVRALAVERLIVIVSSSWIFVNGLELARSAAYRGLDNEAGPTATEASTPPT